MTFWIKNWMFIGILLILLSCGTARRVDYNYDRSIDFTGYKTFAWAPDSSTVAGDDIEKRAYDTDIVGNNAKNYINYSLSQRGYLVDIDSPDMVLQLVLLNEEKERIVTHQRSPYYGYYFSNPFYFPYYYPRYRYYTWYGWGFPPYWEGPITQSTQTFMTGTITLNIYDRKLKKLVWTGSSEGNLYDPKYIHYHVHPVVDLILAKFPVDPIKTGRKRGGKHEGKVLRINGINRDILDHVYPPSH